MNIRRVALIFDDTARPETTGVYCFSALEKLVEVVRFHPSQLQQVPRQGFDLYLQIDDGLEYRHPPELRPAAWWAIDTHLNFDWCRKKAADFDFVFAAQRDGAERLRQAGIASAQWLPLACDPAVHHKHRRKKRYNVCFVGNLFPGARSQLVDLIARQVPDIFVGRCYFDEMAKTYSASRIVFNRSIANDVNMRVFEALACGSLLLTNDLAGNGQAELFKDGVHLATYTQADELLDKIAYYLKNEDVSERIAEAGRREVIARHTYRHRMQYLLEQASGVPRPDAGRDAQADLRSDSELNSDMQPDLEHARRETMPPEPTRLPPVSVPSYFECARPELVALVPESARRVLDIGCGAGRLGEAIKKRQPAEVVGIEREETPAAAASFPGPAGF
jgi:O-antigen biosynthesis protein